jgi:hypothetical protein
VLTFSILRSHTPIPERNYLKGSLWFLLRLVS